LDLELGRLFPQHPSTALESAAVDALPPRGKRVRATLTLLRCEAFSGDYRPAIPLGVAYELAHASALVQGGIIDRSGTGRGRRVATVLLTRTSRGRRLVEVTGMLAILVLLIASSGMVLTTSSQYWHGVGALMALVKTVVLLLVACVGGGSSEMQLSR
jgi:geranylgeranyl pyrophosphate synthase